MTLSVLPLFCKPNQLIRAAVLALWAVLPLTACVSPSSMSPTAPFIIDDSSYRSSGYSERVQFIILHYTAEDEAASLDILTNGNVSAHYLVPSSENDLIYRLVDEDKRAWHAGRGGFDNRTVLNDTSIGIEIVNLGIYPQYRGRDHVETLANNGYHPAHHFVPFTELQIQKVAKLLQDLSHRYDINPTHIIAHSDMAPSRKIDPGAKFPWERLYTEYGIGAWYDETDKQYFMQQSLLERPSIGLIKQAFTDYGYLMNNTQEWDKNSQNVIYAFQLHFRPQKTNGIMDVETYAILKALNLKYGGRR